uniref:deoxyhypusine synthase-like n=1 Tax=Myxine glutinosa TaxID=7769 RepID=UPI00358E3597
MNTAEAKRSEPPSAAVSAVLGKSVDLAGQALEVRGYDFNTGIDYTALLASYRTTGLQATAFEAAVQQVNNMIEKRHELVPIEGEGTSVRSACVIFFGYTSNMVSSGLRENIRFLAQHKMVDCLVTTAGGIEEDIIKCLSPAYIGDYTLPGKEMRSKGLNRIGNMLVPNNNYCFFEDWMIPLLDQMLLEQSEQGMKWTPSKMISRMGKEINNPDSILYWAHKNNIPVFSPAITDGSIGDMIFFHSFKKPGLILDIVEDIISINRLALAAPGTGILILGGGLIKHHICNANLMRNGANYAVFINTGQEFEGSDSGASPDEAVSWGKIRSDATPIKVHAEASLVFPLLVAETFARDFFARNKATVKPTDEDGKHKAGKVDDK